jgi:Protein of unknown function (DUF2851)
MKEEFLYYIWQNKLLLKDPLLLESGEKLEIVHPGIRNFESGPDFTNARIRIDDILWAGNIEIHVNSSDWFKHKHQGDLAYDNILLHVVHQNDKPILRMNGSALPTLVMREKYPLGYLYHYENLIQGSHSFIPCSQQFQEVPFIHIQSWLDRILMERLETRFDELNHIHKSSGQRWPVTLYRLLSKSFGFKVNAIPFEMLSSSVPYEIMLKHRQQIESLEALYYGQSGMLHTTVSDPYVERLKKEYKFFRTKYHLQSISPHLWKYGGLRPANFPTLRISQFSMLHYTHEYLLDKIIQTIELSDLVSLFDMGASDYWFHHFRFGLVSEPHLKKLGKDAILHLLINAIIPFLFFFGKSQGLQVLCDKAIYWMENCPPEKNKIIRSFEDIGFYISNAGQSQALLHLKKNYCDYKKCVNCSIGNHLLKNAVTN